MARLIISTAMTVDGVTDVSGWFVSGGGHDQAGRDQLDGATMLMGRKTYEGLAGYWPAQEGPWGELLNPMPKLVASRTLDGPLEWNAALLEGDAGEAVARAKEERDGDLVQIGCGEFAGFLLDRDLVDELRFWVHPAVWGDGARPFGGEQLRLRQLGATVFDSGVVLLRYEPLAV